MRGIIGLRAPVGPQGALEVRPRLGLVPRIAKDGSDEGQGTSQVLAVADDVGVLGRELFLECQGSFPRPQLPVRLSHDLKSAGEVHVDRG